MDKTLLTFLAVSALIAPAFGQSTCSDAFTASVFIRGEGQAELVGDLTFTCSGSGGLATVQVFLSPAVQITSKILSTNSSNYTEAMAITSSGSVQGIVDPSGTSITFTGVPLPAAPFPASALVTVTNIRINAASAPTGSGYPGGIKASIFLSGTGVFPTLIPTPPLAYIFTGLGPQSVTGVSVTALGTPSGATPASLIGCAALTPALPSFFVKFGEAYGAAFKQRGSPSIDNVIGSSATQNTETGYVPAAFPNTPGASNVAASATRVRILLTSVPNNVLVYFPTSLVTDSPGAGTMNLTASETGPFAPFAAVPPTASNGLPSAPGAPGLALVPSSAGTIEAVYEVAAQTPAIEAYTVPVYFGWAANTVTGTNTPIGVSVSFAPVPTSGAMPLPVPSFAMNASTNSLVGPTINSCVTSLLFPFVTNQSGFDTALVIANTSTDPFGANGASGQSGTCNLDFYGLGSPTPSSNVLSPNGVAADGSYAPGQAYAFQLSSVAVGFQGYLIVVCNFQNAHGYAAITSNVGQPNGTMMGYVGLVVPRGPGVNAESAKN